MLGFAEWQHATGNVYGDNLLPEGTHTSVYIQTISKQPDGYIIKTVANFTYFLADDEQKAG